MQLDVRMPIGLLFGFLGFVLAVYGLFSDRDIYRVSLGINVNLGWGLAMLIFGVVMFFFGWKSRRAV
ncbi:MAG TPA: hypothetical protein VKB87_24900 [Myxococcaceae bacterium]|nr:hypothetical protein [Myxococcaceae bacterium]